MNETISLHCHQGGSDKVYFASLESSGNGFLVNFSYGRRGSTLTAGTKTASPVPYAKAKGIFDKLVSEKMGKGYVVTAGAVPTYANAINGEKVQTGIFPQLLTDTDEDHVVELASDSFYVFQEKKDGKRMLLRKVGSTLTAINRKGFECGVSSVVSDYLLKLPQDFLIDGESIGDVYYTFDCLELHGVDLRSMGYTERLVALEAVFHIEGWSNTSSVLRVRTAFTHAEKMDLLRTCREKNCEGIVAKRRSAPYTSGRGLDQYKFKFKASASVIVSRQNDKRSIQMHVHDGKQPVFIGNCTIPVNHDLPPVGSVVEVEYLYAFPGGSLFQPVYKGRRDDVDIDNCLVSQLKYKQGTTEEDEDA